MRRHLIAFLLGLTLFTNAHAADAGHAVRPDGPVQHRADSASLHDFTGQYTLQDGRLLTVSAPHRALAAQLDGQAQQALQATGPARFATADDALILQFDQRANGNVAAVTVTFTVTATATAPSGALPRVREQPATPW